MLAKILIAMLLSWMGLASSDHAAAENKYNSKTVILILENHEYAQVIGNPGMPYLNQLASRYRLLTNYYAVAHPSLPNYLALLSGQTLTTSDCGTCLFRANNLPQQLNNHEINWRAYMYGMPSPCYQEPSYGDYVRRHNPFAYFSGISSRPCKIVPGERLSAALDKGHLTPFTWITPNLCQDGHDCPLNITDSYLKIIVPKIVAQLHGADQLIITFDEGSSVAHGGGHVATLVIGPNVRSGSSAVFYTHYSLLASLEKQFHLKSLRAAASANIIQ